MQVNDNQRQEAKNKVLALDLSKYISKFALPILEGGYALSLEQAQIAHDRYKKWLYLAMIYGAHNIEVDQLQDLFWHLHLLDTKKYHEDCMNLFGYYLHHDPYPEINNETNPNIIKWVDILKNQAAISS